jgi:MFS transporter, ACS family, glucarate transporter
MGLKFPYRYRILIFLFFLILITYLDRVCISVVGVRIKSEFNLSNEKFGWVLAAFSLAYALCEIPAGAMGDRIGQRRILIRIVLWWSLFTALTGLTMGLFSLILVRFLFGMGEAGAFPNSCGVISHWFPKSETARGLSSVFLGLNVGAAIAPLIVVPIAIAYGWRTTFFVNGFIGLLWVLVCYSWFRNNPSEMKGISEKEKRYIEENRRFQTRPDISIWRSALKNRNLLTLSIAFLCSQWGNYFFLAWMPVYLQEGKHFSEHEMKMTSFFVFITGVIVVLSVGVVSDWLVKKRGLVFGRRFFGVLAQGGSCIFLLLASLISNNIMVVIMLVIGHLFFSANGIASFSTCVDIGGSKAGTVAGVMNFFGQVGGFLLSMSFGKIADLANNFTVPIFVLASVLLIGSLLWFFVDPRKQVVLEESKRQLLAQQNTI